MTHQEIVDKLTRNSQAYNQKGRWRISINGAYCNVGKPIYRNKGTARRKIIDYIDRYGVNGPKVETETMVDDLINQGIIKIEQV